MNIFTLQTQTLTALAHPTRLEILAILRTGDCCVCHIQAVLDQRQAYISQHLNILRNAGLVTNRKEGKRVYYQVADPQIYEVLDTLKAYLQAQNGESGFDQALSLSPRQPCACPQCAVAS